MILLLAAALGYPATAKVALKTETRYYPTEIEARDVTLSKGESVFKLELRPKRLLVLTQDVIATETGKTLLSAGTQLVPQTIIDGGVNYCTTRPARGNLWTGENMMCFTDKDGDLSFEEYFWTISALSSGVATGYFVPDNIKKVLRVDAVEIPISEFDRNLTIQLDWVGGDGLRKPIQFRGSFCVDGRCDWETRRFKAVGERGQNISSFLSSAVSCNSTQANRAVCQLTENSRAEYIAIDVRGIDIVKGGAL
ncbi:MAG: hypothetical protein AAF494_07035 [Pseudomonadota bacterium]